MTFSSAPDGPFQPTWQPATWSAYERIRDLPGEDSRLFFHRGYLLIDRVLQSQLYCLINDLMPVLFFQWLTRRDQSFKAYRRCRLENPEHQAASPDQVLYLGELNPSASSGQHRTLDLQQARVPDLIVEILDTVLLSDLGKKKLYGALGLSEYWVIDLGSLRVSMAQLTASGRYVPLEHSAVLTGLPAAMVEGILLRVVETGDPEPEQWLLNQVLKYG